MACPEKTISILPKKFNIIADMLTGRLRAPPVVLYAEAYHYSEGNFGGYTQSGMDILDELQKLHKNNDESTLWCKMRMMMNWTFKL